MKRGQNFDGHEYRKLPFSCFWAGLGFIFDPKLDPKPLSIVFLAVVPEFLEVTFDRFFRAPKGSNNYQKTKNVKKNEFKKTFLVGGIRR